ncbi:MAG: HU family DNA-binding protein [Anaerolineales bacterium]|nr:HU family DNA-binding protein [Anaerolineales bacterium]
MAGKRLTKFQFIDALAGKSGLTNKQAESALEAIGAIVFRELGKRGPGDVLIPGLLRLMVVRKPATPQYEGVNPFTREPMMYKARAARRVIRVRSRNELREAVLGASPSAGSCTE